MQKHKPTAPLPLHLITRMTLTRFALHSHESMPRTNDYSQERILPTTRFALRKLKRSES